MKKLLLTCTVVAATFIAQSQVIFKVNTPPGIAGNKQFTWADPAGGDWMTPDFLIPNTFIEDTLKVYGAGTADTLACNPFPAGTFTGKIALVYRGGCEFGAKAFNAQNAGAVGVVIVNNVVGAPIEMGGGVNGINVTVPTAMVSQADGAAMRNQVNMMVPVEVFIGNKSGIFANDLGFFPGDVLISPLTSIPLLTASNATDFSFAVGGTVFNYGTTAQATTVVTATVTFAGSPVYTQSTAPTNIPSGDSLTFTLPDFSLPAYAPGRYKLTYSVSNGAIMDESSADNSLTSEFRIDDKLISYAVLDTVTKKPLGSNGYRIANATGDFSTCIVYRNPKANLLAVDGLWISALMGNTATAVGDSLYGEEIIISVLEWNDAFTDLNDAGLAFNNLNEIASSSYTYPGGPTPGAYQAEAVYAKFTNQIPLNANQRYLFCETTSNENVFFTFSTDINYTANENEYLQPYYALNNDGAYSLGFTNVQSPPAMAVSTFNVAELSIAKNTILDATAYPNPTTDKVKVSIKSVGAGVVNVTDLNGRVVVSNAINLNGGLFEVSLSSVEAGMYIFNVTMENGDTAQFNVVKK